MRPAVSLKTILLAIAVVVVSFFVSLKTMDWLSPRATVGAPVLFELSPLPSAPRGSVILAPVAIALTAIRDAADRSAPRNFAGKADNPVSQILAERRYRLDRFARADHGDRRPGRADAANAIDRKAECNRLADVEGDRRGR